MPITAAPALACVLAAISSAATLPLDTETYGCGSGPQGSLIVLSGHTALGTTLVLGVDNPLGTQAPGSIPVLFLSALPDPAFPCGTPAYGLSMSGPAVPGELLIDVFGPALLSIAIGAPWVGPGVPTPFPVALPALPFLVGKTVYAQGAIVDPTSSTVALGATEAVRIGLEQPCGGTMPCIDLVSNARESYVQTYGYDWEYDDGQSVLHEHTTGTSVHDATTTILDLDWWGSEVAAGTADHDSEVGPREIRCDFACSASTFGNHFSEDASSSCELHAVLHANERLRFTASGQGTVSYGYNEVTVSLVGGAGSAYSLGAYQGQDDQLSTTGWLQPGPYVLDAVAVAFAYGNNGFFETQTAELDLVVRFFHQCDHDTDGDVDQDDHDAFHQDLATGSPFADIDGNGVADPGDAVVFDAAWNAVQGL